MTEGPCDPDVTLNEAERIAALHSYDILDTLPETDFDDITRLAAYVCDVPIALISLVDEDRQWFKSRVGLDAAQTPRDVSFCAHALGQDSLLIVPDAIQDPRFRRNPLVTGDTNLRFYAGAPLNTPDGHSLGTLCVVDHKPRTLTAAQQDALKALGSMVIAQLELRARNAAQQTLLAEKERLLAERDAAQERLHLLEMAVENASDVILISEAEPIDLPGPRVVYVNPAFTQMTGYEPEDIIGQTPRILQGPKTSVETRAFLREKLKAWEPVRVELLNYRKDGSEFWAELNVRPVANADGWYTHWVAVQRDITDRKRVEERLRLLESVVVHANDAVVITEAEPISLPGPRILYVNEAFTRMTGYAADEVIGRTPRLLQGPETDLTINATIRAALEKWEPVRVEALNYRKDGTPFWVDFSITPVADERGWFTHWVSVQRDITDRKQADARMEEVNEELERRVRVRTAELQTQQGVSAAGHRHRPEPDLRQRLGRPLHAGEPRPRRPLRDHGGGPSGLPARLRGTGLRGDGELPPGGPAGDRDRPGTADPGREGDGRAGRGEVVPDRQSRPGRAGRPGQSRPGRGDRHHRPEGAGGRAGAPADRSRGAGGPRTHSQACSTTGPSTGG